MVAQPVNKFPVLYGTGKVITCSLEPAIGPYPEPDESSLHVHTLFLWSILMLYFRLRLDLPRELFPSGFAIRIFR